MVVFINRKPKSSKKHQRNVIHLEARQVPEPSARYMVQIPVVLDVSGRNCGGVVDGVGWRREWTMGSTVPANIITVMPVAQQDFVGGNAGGYRRSRGSLLTDLENWQRMRRLFGSLGSNPSGSGNPSSSAATAAAVAEKQREKDRERIKELEREKREAAQEKEGVMRGELESLRSRERERRVELEKEVRAGREKEKERREELEKEVKATREKERERELLRRVGDEIDRGFKYERKSQARNREIDAELELQRERTRNRERELSRARERRREREIERENLRIQADLAAANRYGRAYADGYYHQRRRRVLVMD